MILEIGKQTDIFARYGECCVFDLDDAGFILGYNYNSPTTGEINAFASGQEFKIGFVRVNGVLFILFKIGNTDWNDAPFAYHLARTTKLSEVADGEGYTLTAVIVDRLTKTVKGLRIIGLGTDFSRKLRKEIMADAEKTVMISDHNRRVGEVYNRYSTKDLVMMCDQNNMFAL